MSPLTPLAVLALSLLGERPMHPYEMLQTMRTRRADQLVRLGPGALYHTVDRLVRDGLAEPEGVDRDGNRPERTIYRVTPLGRDLLADAVEEMLVSPVPEYPRLPVALSELNNLPRTRAIDLLERRDQALRGVEAELSAVATMLTERPLPKRYWLQLDFTQAMLAAQRAWIASTLTDLRSGELEWSDTKPKDTP